jgi:hypothetical protein
VTPDTAEPHVPRHTAGKLLLCFPIPVDVSNALMKGWENWWNVSFLVRLTRT